MEIQSLSKARNELELTCFVFPLCARICYNREATIVGLIVYRSILSRFSSNHEFPCDQGSRVLVGNKRGKEKQREREREREGGAAFSIVLWKCFAGHISLISSFSSWVSLRQSIVHSTVIRRPTRGICREGERQRMRMVEGGRRRLHRYGAIFPGKYRLGGPSSSLGGLARLSRKRE